MDPGNSFPLRAIVVNLIVGSRLVVACGAPSPPASAAPDPQPAPGPAPFDAALEPAATADSGATAAPLPAIVPLAAALLSDGFEQRHPERALPRAARADAPPRVVVAKEPGRARYVFDDPSMRLLVWADDAALFETPLAVTALTRHPAKPGAKERVLVGPGAYVERKSEKAGFALITARDHTFGVEGYVPAAALGHVYLPTSIPEVPGSDQWVLSRTVPILDKPGGAALGKLLDASGPQVRVTALAQGAAWFVEIVYQSPSLSVRGFVPKSALSPPQAGSWGRGYASLGRNDPPMETLTFPAGACLYSEPWGEVVGVLRRPRTASVHIEEGARAAWRKLEPSHVGASVWLPREGSSATPPPNGAPAEPLSLADGFRCAAPPRR